MVIDLNKLIISRIEKGINVTELHRLSGVGRSTIERIEKGETSPRPDTIGKIIKALNIDVKDIIKIENEKL